MIGAGNKSERLLDLYDRFNRGAVLTKSELASTYGVTEKTIQRDINELRAYLAESGRFSGSAGIQYDKKQKGYVLVHASYEHLSNQETLAIAKVLLESRAFEPAEMKDMLDKLIVGSSPESRETVEGMIRNEAFCYVPLQHGKKLLPVLWALSTLIAKRKVITFVYTRQDGVKKIREVKPVAILFSEFYFYLLGFPTDENHPYPYTFRVDRMEKVKTTGAIFRIPYSERFSDGEFRKRIQFMYGGPLHTVKFLYKGPSIEAVLDRLPTAKVLEKHDGVYTLKAEAYGKGINMWLASQGDMVEVLSTATE